MITCSDAVKQNEDMLTLPKDGLLYWQEFINAQSDWLVIFKKFARLVNKRKVNSRKSMVMIGQPGVGKSWCTAFIGHDGKCGYCSVKETGVGRWTQVLDHDIIIIDDPHDHWLRSDRQTVLNLLSGTSFPVKVHSTTKHVKYPRHVIILCNRRPVDMTPELADRLSFVNIGMYRREATANVLPRYSYAHVWNYLYKFSHTILTSNRVPCICMLWNSHPCHSRSRNDKPLICTNTYI